MCGHHHHGAGAVVHHDGGLWASVACALSIRACSSALVGAAESWVRKPVSSAERNRSDAGEHGNTQVRAGSIRPRRASVSSRRRRARRSAERKRARSPRPPHRRAAGARFWHWRPAAPRRSGRGRGSARRRAPRAGRSQCRARKMRRSSRPCCASACRRLRQPVAERDERPRQPVGDRRDEQRHAEDGEQHQCGDRGRIHWRAPPSRRRPRPSVATAAKVSAMPASSGRPVLTKGWSARAKTKGSTGRMQGLTIVSTPPR